MSTSDMQPASRWRRMPGPLKIGLVAAALGLALAIAGIIRGNVPLNPLSIFLALLISGGSWGLVAWAVATAAADVDEDLEATEADAEAAAEAQKAETDTVVQPRGEQ